MAVAEARILAPAEVDELEQRLANRDPSVDVGRELPRLIHTLHARDAQISGQSGSVIKAERELRELQERFDALQVEMTRELAVIAVARRSYAMLAGGLLQLESTLADFDAGKLVFGG